MKKTALRTIMRAVLAFVFSTAVLLATAYFFLLDNLGSETADVSEESVPYERAPDNCGLLFKTVSGLKILFYLNFNSLQTTVLIIDDDGQEKGEYAGYGVDFTVDADSRLVEGMIDRIGGIELELEGERLRYTGVQITELVSRDVGDRLKNDIIHAICEKIAQNGLEIDDFVFLIENSQTELTVPDCYTWQEDMAIMFSRANIMYF